MGLKKLYKHKNKDILKKLSWPKKGRQPQKCRQPKKLRQSKNKDDLSHEDNLKIEEDNLKNQGEILEKSKLYPDNSNKSFANQPIMNIFTLSFT